MQQKENRIDPLYITSRQTPKSLGCGMSVGEIIEQQLIPKQNIIGFGRFKGQHVETLQKEQDYCVWVRYSRHDDYMSNGWIMLRTYVLSHIKIDFDNLVHRFDKFEGINAAKFKRVIEDKEYCEWVCLQEDKKYFPLQDYYKATVNSGKFIDELFLKNGVPE